ncbi:MAG: imidazolonepropionase [Anaerolineae bacterium]
MKIDLLIHSAGQLITCAGDGGGPKRGDAMREVGLIPNGAVAVDGGEIIAVGESSGLRARFTPAQSIDAAGKVVCPGFVDPHTHVVYAGDRVDEFERRIKGAAYIEIMQAGGGIAATMRATRAAGAAQLVAESRPRLDAMLALGTTTVEIKTGYGLNTAAELKMLRAIEILADTHPAGIVPTFLGAHAVPPEYKGRPDEYVALVIDEMLPQVAGWWENLKLKTENWQLKTENLKLFCDVFCEAGVFSVAQSRRVLEAGIEHGLAPKLHADEFENLGGVSLAVELGATSVDHLDVTPAAEVALLARSNTVGVALPAVNFNLGSAHFADARALIDAGVALALATDINPGSAPCPSMPLVMALATRYQHLLPAEALNATTLNAACAIGLGNQLGSLEAGKQADLLIINAPDYRHLAYRFGKNLVERVIKRGRVVI